MFSGAHLEMSHLGELADLAVLTTDADKPNATLGSSRGSAPVDFKKGISFRNPALN